MSKPTSTLLPDQKTGAEKNYEHAVRLSSVEEAQKQFQRSKKRLLDVSKWQQVAGKGTAQFELTNQEGQKVNRKPKVGDHIKIDIPSPTHQHDWVRIESIEEQPSTPEEDLVGMTVRPTTNPITRETHVSHFFSPSSTSTFIVRREKDKVIAQVHGRNEVPNTETKSIWQMIKNLAVAIGAIAGVADVQWNSLVKGLVETKKNK